MVSSKISLTLDLLRCMGPKWVCFRSTHALKQKIGLFERQLPLAAWKDSKLEEHLTERSLARPDLYLEYRRRASPAFFFRAEDKRCFKSSLAAWHDQSRSPVGMAEGIRKG